MKELIEFIAGKLVEHPEHIEVKLQEEEDNPNKKPTTGGTPYMPITLATYVNEVMPDVIGCPSDELPW